MEWSKENRDFVENNENVHPTNEEAEIYERIKGKNRMCFTLHNKYFPKNKILAFNLCSLSDHPINSMHQLFENDKSLIINPSYAIYYSIISLKILVRISSVLIHLIAEHLEREMNISFHQTLSPIPSLSEFLVKKENLPLIEKNLSTEQFSSLLKAYQFCKQKDPHFFERETANKNEWLNQLMLYLFNHASQKTIEEIQSYLQSPMLELARYLIRDTSFDSVAKFHLNNGAQFLPENVFWMADLKPVRMKQSLGIMTSYIYK